MNALVDIKLSLEMMPNHTEDFLDSYKYFQSIISPNQFKIFITHVNGTDYSDILEASKKLTILGFTVIPHLAVRNLKNGENIHQIFKELEQSKITHLLLLGGDNSHSIHFQSVKEVINAHNLSKYNFQTVYLPTFPEGHPHITNSVEHLDQLMDKYDSLKNQNLAVHFISQICLDFELLSNHIKKLESICPNPLITIGYLAPIKTAKLIKIATNIGLSNLVSFLSQGKIFKLLKPYDSDQLVSQLITQHKIDALHCYAFGNYTGSFEKMIQYQNQIEQQNLSFSNIKEVR